MHMRKKADRSQRVYGSPPISRIESVLGIRQQRGKMKAYKTSKHMMQNANRKIIM